MTLRLAPAFRYFPPGFVVIQSDSGKHCLQPVAIVGPGSEFINTLLFRYQIAVWRELLLKNTKSGCPSPLKSAASLKLQAQHGNVGAKAPPTKILLFKYQIPVWVPRIT